MKRIYLAIALLLALTTGCQSPTKNSPQKVDIEKSTSQSSQPVQQIELENQKPAIQKTEPASFIPIVANGYLLLGSYEKGQWHDPEKAAARINGSENYTVYTLNKKVAEVKGKTISHEELVGAPTVELKYVPSEAVAVGSPHNAIPRQIQKLNVQSKEYLKIADEYLKSQGLTQVKPEIKQLYKVDLDGNGSDEVLMNLSNLDFENIEAHQKAGTYSVLLLRQIVDGKVKTIPVFNEIYKENDTEEEWKIPYLVNITNVLDVNGDGTMEVIDEVRYYEGNSFDLLELEKTGLKSRIGTGVGV